MWTVLYDDGLSSPSVSEGRTTLWPVFLAQARGQNGHLVVPTYFACSCVNFTLFVFCSHIKPILEYIGWLLSIHISKINGLIIRITRAVTTDSISRRYFMHSSILMLSSYQWTCVGHVWGGARQQTRIATIWMAICR